MRNLVWILVAVVIAGGAYWLYSGQTPRDIVNEATQGATPEETEDTAAPEEPAEAAGEAVEDAAVAAEETAEDLSEGAQSLAEDAAETAGDAADAVVEAAEDAADAAADAADTAMEAAEDATTSATGTGTAAGAPDAQEVLTVDGFDFEQAQEVIENSDISATQKSLLQTALENARDDPEQLQTVLEQIRDALDL